MTSNPPNDWFREIHHGGATPRVSVIGMPYSGSGVAMFGKWKDALGKDVQLSALALPGREDKLTRTPRANLIDLADELANELAAGREGRQTGRHAGHQTGSQAGGTPDPSTPLVLVGFSMGGWLAFETARRLQTRGRPVALLVAAASRAPQTVVTGGRWHPEHWTSLSRHSGKLHTIVDDRKFLQQMNRVYAAVPPAIIDNEEMRGLLTPMLRGDIAMIETYRYREGPVLEAEIMTLSGSDDAIVRPKHVVPWRELTRRYRHRTFAGDHYFERSQTDAVLAAIRRRVDKIG